MLLTTSAAHILRMFRAVSLVNTLEMKKPSEEGFGRAVHQCERISFCAFCYHSRKVFRDRSSFRTFILKLGQLTQIAAPMQTINSEVNIRMPKAVWLMLFLNSY